MDTSLLQSEKVFYGVVHLLPLPGSPLYSGNIDQICEQMISDINAYLEGQVDGIIIENFHDIPFFKEEIPPETLTAMTWLAIEAKKIIREIPLGINILRNAAIPALAVAAITKASFIRVNVLTGAMLTDQGVIEGCAAELLRYRGHLGSHIKILADVHVKHAVPLVERSLEAEIEDTIHRSMADGIIISGEGTGKPPSVEKLKKAASAVNHEVPLFVGSGMTQDNINSFLPYADGFIIGTAVKKENHVDSNRVKVLTSMIHH